VAACFSSDWPRPTGPFAGRTVGAPLPFQHPGLLTGGRPSGQRHARPGTVIPICSPPFRVLFPWIIDASGPCARHLGNGRVPSPSCQRSLTDGLLTAPRSVDVLHDKGQNLVNKAPRRRGPIKNACFRICTIFMFGIIFLLALFSVFLLCEYDDGNTQGKPMICIADSFYRPLTWFVVAIPLPPPLHASNWLANPA